MRRSRSASRATASASSPRAASTIGSPAHSSRHNFTAPKPNPSGSSPRWSKMACSSACSAAGSRLAYTSTHMHRAPLTRLLRHRIRARAQPPRWTTLYTCVRRGDLQVRYVELLCSPAMSMILFFLRCNNVCTDHALVMTKYVRSSF